MKEGFEVRELVTGIEMDRIDDLYLSALLQSIEGIKHELAGL
jgi:hypothetical protein